MFTKKTSYTGIFFAFTAGVIAGAAVALLYAPMSGKKMQKKVAGVIDKVEDLQDQVRKFATA